MLAEASSESRRFDDHRVSQSASLVFTVLIDALPLGNRLLFSFCDGAELGSRLQRRDGALESSQGSGRLCY